MRMAFPESGDSWLPHGLATVTIDRDTDSGRYWEPNVWVQHEVWSSLPQQSRAPTLSVLDCVCQETQLLDRAPRLQVSGLDPDAGQPGRSHGEPEGVKQIG